MITEFDIRYLEIAMTIVIMLDLLLIVYYRRFWSIIKGLGWDAMPGLQHNMKSKKLEGPKWLKFR